MISDRRCVLEGMPVYSADGAHVGKVTRCGQEHFELEKGLFITRDYILAYQDVDRVDDSGVYLNLTKKQVKVLLEREEMLGDRAATDAPNALGYTTTTLPPPGQGDVGLNRRPESLLAAEEYRARAGILTSAEGPYGEKRVIPGPDIEGPTAVATEDPIRYVSSRGSSTPPPARPGDVESTRLPTEKEEHLDHEYRRNAAGLTSSTGPDYERPLNIGAVEDEEPAASTEDESESPMLMEGRREIDDYLF